MTGPADLEERIATVVGHLNVLHAELVGLVAEAAATGAWAGDGIRSLRHWLTWKAGVSSARAGELVRLAEATTTHPATMAELAAGTLTVDQAAVAVGAPAHHDVEVAQLAPLATVNQLRTIVRCARPVPASPSPSMIDEPVESVSTWHDDDGRFHGRIELDADRGAVVDAALGAARDRLFHDGERAVTWADALLDVCHRSLDREDTPRRERFRINLFLDPTADIPSTWADGFAVPDAVRRRLTCDGRLVPAFVQAGRTVSVGRSQRVVPERTRRTVLHRDTTCRVPWCGNSRWLDVHHVVHWEDGGRTDTDNLCALCTACHRATTAG